MINKKFDCIEMKRKIQEELQNEIKEMTNDEKRIFMRTTIVSNPELKKIWEQIIHNSKQKETNL